MVKKIGIEFGDVAETVETEKEEKVLEHPKDKMECRNAVGDDVAAFLARGGTVTQLPSVQDQPRVVQVYVPNFLK